MSTSISDDGILFNDNTLQNTAFRYRSENFIVNGAMAVSQEKGDTAGVFAVGTYYPVDEVTSGLTGSTGCTLTSQQVAQGNGKAVRVTATVAATALTGSEHVGSIGIKLEAQSIRHLNGGKVTLSFKCSTNWAGELPIALVKADFTKSYVSSSTVVNGDNDISITIQLESDTVPDAGADLGLYLYIGYCNEGDLQTTTEGEWVAGGYFSLATQTQWVKTAGNFVEVTQIQLEEGSVASPFQHKSYAQDLADCQRYFVQLANKDLYGMGGYCESSSLFYSSVNLPVTIRRELSISDFTVASGALWVGRSGANVAVVSNNTMNVGENGKGFISFSAAGLTGGQGAQLAFVGDTRINFNARL